VVLGARLDGVTDVAEALAEPTLAGGALQAFARGGEQRAGRRADHADPNRARGVGAVVILVAGEIDADDVALAQDFVGMRDTVHHRSIDGGAEHGGVRREPAWPVSEKGRARLGACDLAGCDAVQLGSRHSGEASGLHGVENSGDDAARGAHLVELVTVLEDDSHARATLPLF
jgi:hypothetical protein